MNRVRTFEVESLIRGSIEFHSLPSAFQKKIFNKETMFKQKTAKMVKAIDIQSMHGNDWFIPKIKGKCHEQDGRILMIMK